MGADLIGYTLVRPAKGADKIAKKQIDKLKTVLSNAAFNDKQKVEKLIDLGVCFDGALDDEETTDTEFIETVQGEIEALGNDDFLVDGFYRDINSRLAKVGKKEIEIIFAGELSWGDEPQGSGYEALKRYVTLGISDAWERALK